MPNVYATPDDCKSELGKKMQFFRADRPSEWLMDEFIRQVEKLAAALDKVESDLEQIRINGDS